MATSNPMVPTPTNHGMSHEEALYRGRALACLRRLKMANKGLTIYHGTYQLPGGVEVFCNVCGNNESVQITLPKSMLPEIEKIPSLAGNFFCHPRIGNVVLKTIFDGQLTREYFVVDHAGFNVRGSSIPDAIAAYPLSDTDHATFLIAETEDSYTISWSSFEAYGNIDWCGRIRDGKPTSVLTWKGPPSRYFPEVTQPEGIHFGRYVYQNGKVVATVPMTGRFTELMDEIPYYVLGAAFSTDSEGKDWLVVIVREYAIEDSGVGIIVYSAIAVLAKPAGSLDDNFYSEEHQLGWVKMYDDYQINSGITLLVPMFFNDSGSEARTIMGRNECRIAIDINNKSASITTTQINIAGSRVYSGSTPISTTSGDLYVVANYVPGSFSSKTGDGGEITETSRRKIAVDWNNGEFSYAEIDWSFSATGFTGSSFTMTVSQMTEYGSRTYTSIAEAGAEGDHEASCHIIINGMSVETCKYSRSYYSKQVNDMANNFGWNINDGPPPGTHQFVDNVDRHYASWDLSAILYMDIRHDICVTNNISLESSSEQYVNLNYQINGENIDPTYRDISSQSRTASLNILAPWGKSSHSGFSFNLLDTTSGYFPNFNMPDCPVIGPTPYTEDSVFDWLLASNQPCFSAAFDLDGNSCYSLLYDGGSINSHADILEQLKFEGTGTMVMFPVAPF